MNKLWNVCMVAVACVWIIPTMIRMAREANRKAWAEQRIAALKESRRSRKEV